jgi:hypothetical protein
MSATFSAVVAIVLFGNSYVATWQHNWLLAVGCFLGSLALVSWRRNPSDPLRVEWLHGDEIIACDRADAYARRPAERE